MQIPPLRAGGTALLSPPGTGDAAGPGGVGDRCLSSGAARGQAKSGGGNTETSGIPHASPYTTPGSAGAPNPCVPARPSGERGGGRGVASLRAAAGRGAARPRRRMDGGERRTSPPEPLLKPPHGSGPPAPAGGRAGGRDGRLRAAPEAARAGVRALIGVRAAAARSDGRRRPSVRSGNRAGGCGRPL